KADLWRMKYTKEMMLTHYHQWEESGLTKLAYCVQENLSYQAFCKFCSRQNSDSANGFTLIKSKPSLGSIQFHLPNGCYFLLPEDCSDRFLKKLLSLC
ncbi:MAG: hypothetical protein MH472_05550, partial [Bacteroidia bacterium]|nr:hypothetical protein [Bacteroidia bacterium]